MSRAKLSSDPVWARAFQVALDAPATVGTWAWAAGTDSAAADAVVALLFGLDPDSAEAGLPLTAYLAGIHRADRTRVLAQFRLSARDGHPFVAEFRVRSRACETRWVLSRCQFSYDHRGRPVQGRGIIVDVTSLHGKGGVHDPIAGAALVTGGSPLERAADSAMVAHQDVCDLQDAGLKARADELLFEIGRRLAGEQARERRHRLN
jgi:hypothetical protein